MKIHYLSLLIKKIIKDCNKLKKTEMNYHFIINLLIILNLKIEKILFDKKNRNGNPLIIAAEYLRSFYIQILDLKKLNDFDSMKKINVKKLAMEYDHKKLFQKLWVNYTDKQYIFDRVQRYIHRIKINNLTKLLKNKKIIDFGCGHGNFLIAAKKIGARYCYGIDYGKESIKFANKVKKKLKISNIKFEVANIYHVRNAKSNFFDFAIQNGVFHHLEKEFLGYKELHRTLKPGGYMWIYTDGGNGIRDLISDMSQKILSSINQDFVIGKIRQIGLVYGKEYHLGDNLKAKYRHTTFNKITNLLKKIGFKNFIKLKGGFKTDFDKPFYKDKYFSEKFGSGDLRILCQKK
jgi:ubiquinone/menaquinone biosynthesis C-methylase UbiE